MIINEKNSTSKAQEQNPKHASSEHVRIMIQCPECPNILKQNENKCWYCQTCNREFTENEIRTRCGL